MIASSSDDPDCEVIPLLSQHPATICSRYEYSTRNESSLHTSPSQLRETGDGFFIEEICDRDITFEREAFTGAYLHINKEFTSEDHDRISATIALERESFIAAYLCKKLTLDDHDNIGAAIEKSTSDDCDNSEADVAPERESFISYLYTNKELTEDHNDIEAAIGGKKFALIAALNLCTGNDDLVLCEGGNAWYASIKHVNGSSITISSEEGICRLCTCGDSVDGVHPTIRAIQYTAEDCRIPGGQSPVKGQFPDGKQSPAPITMTGHVTVHGRREPLTIKVKESSGKSRQSSVTQSFTVADDLGSTINCTEYQEADFLRALYGLKRRQISDIQKSALARHMS